MNKEKLLKKLEIQKENLESMLKRFATEDDKPEGDWDTIFPDLKVDGLEDAADEVEEYASLIAIEHSLEAKLKETNEALERIKTESYGICHTCKKKISTERLEAIPETKFCKDCN